MWFVPWKFVNRKIGTKVIESLKRCRLAWVHGSASLMNRSRLFQEWSSHPITGLASQIMAFKMDDRISLKTFHPYHLLRIQIVVRLWCSVIKPPLEHLSGSHSWYCALEPSVWWANEKKKLLNSPSLKYFVIAEKMERDKKYTLHLMRGIPKNYSIICSPIPKMWLNRSERNKWVKYTNNW